MALFNINSKKLRAYFLANQQRADYAFLCSMVVCGYEPPQIFSGEKEWYIMKKQKNWCQSTLKNPEKDDKSKQCQLTRKKNWKKDKE